MKPEALPSTCHNKGLPTTSVGVRPLMLVAATALLLSSPFAGQSQTSYFPIAADSLAMSLASDGNNYLVGLENHAAAPSTIGAKMLSSSGAKLGPLIATGRSGISTALAFDGVNYLLIWEDDGLGMLNGDTGFAVFGQFISRAGTLAGGPFAIANPGIYFDGIKTLAFGSGKYLVTYTRLINPSLGDHSNNRYIAGRIVNPDASMGPEFRISTGNGQASDVAFDGANFLVIWCEDINDVEIRGRFVSPAGVPGTEILINGSPAPSDNPKSIAFDGANYLVVWNDEVAGKDTGTWDCFGQLVSPSGSLVGGLIPLATDPGPQLVTTVAFDGRTFLAAWVDMSDETNWELYARHISRSGSLVGGRITLSAQPGNQLGGVAAGHGKFVALVNNGVEFGENGIGAVDSAEGMFLPQLPPLSIQSGGVSFGIRNNQFGFTITGPDGEVAIVEACVNPGNSSWAPIATNTLTGGSWSFSDPQWSGYATRFYRVRTP